MKKILSLAVILIICINLFAQETKNVSINIKSGAPSGIIDPKIYGQLFEHIYFSVESDLIHIEITLLGFGNVVPRNSGSYVMSS